MGRVFGFYHLKEATERAFRLNYEFRWPSDGKAVVFTFAVKFGTKSKTQNPGTLSSLNRTSGFA